MTVELCAHVFEEAKQKTVTKINNTFKGVVEELQEQGMLRL